MTPRRRIAVFAYEFPALSETFVLNHVISLIEQGCEVTILAERERAEEISHPTIARYDLRRRTIYHGMPKGRLARVAHGVIMLARSCAVGKTAALRALNGLRFGRNAWSLSLLYWVSRLESRRRDFDIVHCHFGPIGQLAVQLRELGALDATIVTTFHGVDVSWALGRDPHCYRLLFERGDLFLPISEIWRTRLISYGCPAARTEVHRMGVDLGALPFAARRLHPHEPLRLLSIGRLVEKKGIEYALRAASILASRGLEFHYTIVGDGPLWRALQDLVSAAGIEKHVTFVGAQPTTRIPEFLLGHHILVAPSITDRHGDMEGIPVTLMEAMASGMPVVSTWHSGIPELVRNGINGFLVDERDTQSLADTLQFLSDHVDLWQAMGLAARETITQHYNISLQNKRLTKRYEELLDSEHHSRSSALALTDSGSCDERALLNRRGASP